MSKYEICVARFNEDITWLEPMATFATVHVYNKGGALSEIQSSIFNVVQVPNVGLDGYCHLKHIVDHYDDTNVITAFIQARIADHSYSTIPNQFKAFFFEHPFIIETGTSPNICRWPVSMDFFIDGPTENPWTSGYFFGDFWKRYISTTTVDAPANFKWYKNMIFAASSTVLQRRPRTFYESLLNDDIAHHVKPQILHYLERAWFYILHPQWNHPAYIENLSITYAKCMPNSGMNAISETIYTSVGIHDYYTHIGKKSPALLRLTRKANPIDIPKKNKSVIL